MTKSAPEITANAVSVAPERGSWVTVGESVPVRIGVAVDALPTAMVGVEVDALPEDGGTVEVAAGWFVACGAVVAVAWGTGVSVACGCGVLVGCGAGVLVAAGWLTHIFP